MKSPGLKPIEAQNARIPCFNETISGKLSGASVARMSAATRGQCVKDRPGCLRSSGLHSLHSLDKPSLRANGSRECAPDDRLREAIHQATTKKEWIASSLALPCANASRLSQAMTTTHCALLPPTPSSRTIPVRSACGGFRWCRRRSRRAWRRATAARSGSR